MKQFVHTSKFDDNNYSWMQIKGIWMQFITILNFTFLWHFLQQINRLKEEVCWSYNQLFILIWKRMPFEYSKFDALLLSDSPKVIENYFINYLLKKGNYKNKINISFPNEKYLQNISLTFGTIFISKLIIFPVFLLY